MGGGDVPDILVRDVDKATLERLKRRAKRHGRSLQSEAKRLLEQAAGVEDVRAMLEFWDQRLEGRAFPPSWEAIRDDRKR